MHTVKLDPASVDNTTNSFQYEMQCVLRRPEPTFEPWIHPVTPFLSCNLSHGMVCLEAICSFDGPGD